VDRFRHRYHNRSARDDITQGDGNFTLVDDVVNK